MILTGYHDALAALVNGDPNPLAGRSVKEKPNDDKPKEPKQGSFGGFFSSLW